MRAAEGSFAASQKFPKNLVRIYDFIKLPETARCRDNNLWIIDPNVDFSQTSLSAAMSKNGIRNDMVLLESGADGTGPAAFLQAGETPAGPGCYDNAVIVLPDERAAHETAAADRFRAVAKHRHYYVVGPAMDGLSQRVDLRAIHSDASPGADVPACATSLGKRALDVLFSALAIFFLLPLLCLIAILVKATSRGPVILKQERKGLDGKKFSILKFRSMRAAPEPGHVLQAVKNDPRVTPVGKWLRKTSLDELPQLFNVLRGDMSIVGPRPHAVSHDDYYLACVVGYAQRRRVKPGITGWAQVRGARGETPRIEDMKNRIEHDIWYINNWSFSMDVVIIALTFRCLAGHQKAY
jgi:exopolysaccharide biosynthesis polyprenyl glycosylphosphotransferase